MLNVAMERGIKSRIRAVVSNFDLIGWARTSRCPGPMSDYQQAWSDYVQRRN